MERLLEIMALLREPQNGCPWDREQTIASLVPHTLEEAYEVAEAAEHHDLPALRDELGDLLFQVVFYARIAQEHGAFAFADVAAGIADKLTARHPHVFADASVGDAKAQSHAWEALKADEREARLGDSATLAGVAISLPAMTRAVKLQKRAARVGFDWPDIRPVFAKVEEELQEVREEVREHAQGKGTAARVEEEIGDLLFACANLARHAQVNPETALRKANRKFEQRFASMEMALEKSGKHIDGLDLAAMEALWQQAKADERKVQAKDKGEPA